jgi:hypothetical protein
MSLRSLLRQYEQIRRSATYDDDIYDVNNPTVAVSGTNALEHDMNVMRTLFRQVGFGLTASGTNWYDSLGNYFDPTDTDAGDTENKEMSLSNISGNTLDAHTIIMPISEDNSEAGFDIQAGATGFLFDTTLRYATPDNREGLPIFYSTSNSGSYWDEGKALEIVGIDVLDASTGALFTNTAGDVVYAKFHDGYNTTGYSSPTGSGVAIVFDEGYTPPTGSGIELQFGLGEGDGVDTYVRFYTENGGYTTVSGDPSNVTIVHPYRKIIKDVDEWEWARNNFVSSWGGGSEEVDDIVNLWSYTGASDGVSAPSWTNTTSSYVLSASGTLDLTSAIDAINTQIGSRLYLGAPPYEPPAGDGVDFVFGGSYTPPPGGNLDLEYSPGGTFVNNGESIATSLDSLDQNLYSLSQSLDDGVVEKYVEVVSNDIDAGTYHSLPYGITYTPDWTAGIYGNNMDVFVNGQLLTASTGAYGVNDDGDYSETTASGITLHMFVGQYSNITYKVRQ